MAKVQGNLKIIMLRKKNNKGLVLRKKGTRMAEDRRRLKRIGNDGFEKFSQFFSKYAEQSG